MKTPEQYEAEIAALRATLEDYKTDNAAMTAMHEEANKDLMECKRQYAQMADERDAEMLRTKACEAIAEGQEGWERLTNECPSTAAVTALRAGHENILRANEELREELRITRKVGNEALDERDKLREELAEAKQHIRRANKALETPLGNP